MQLGVANAVVRRRKRHSCTIANICSLSDREPAAQPDIGDGQRLFKREPSRLRTLPFAWARIIVTGEQQIPHVEVTMSAWSRVNVDMNELWSVVRVRNHETELFHRLAHRGNGGFFAGVNVATRLQPQPESLVHVQRHTAATDHDRRRGHVPHIGVLVVRVGEGWHDFEKLGDRLTLAIVDGHGPREVCAQLTHRARSTFNHGRQGSSQA